MVHAELVHEAAGQACQPYFQGLRQAGKPDLLLCNNYSTLVSPRRDHGPEALHPRVHRGDTSIER